MTEYGERVRDDEVGRASGVTKSGFGKGAKAFMVEGASGKTKCEGYTLDDESFVRPSDHRVPFVVIPAPEPVSSKPLHFEYLPEVEHATEQLDPGSLSRPG
ncbi:hypothetical protein IMCC21906_00122 [Spongiibacter sp. IMCC21906]|uniref:hypothetical protein n=1 Tax=Spongiibacter sp. IMCC21906 TaxID=1620392 RepID=UPI00062DDFD3|nr:hypothetical protein [Spongiibacter sp. IMCC21906]AKH67816.1 hypothetical protein IMCC21906_00122 [Spongiibacter sp. IMCC21906]